MRTLVLLPILFALASPAAAQNPSADERAIRAALQQWTADYNAKKADAVCGLFATELRYDFRGQPERGYKDICDLLQRSLRDPSKSFQYSPEIKEVIVSGDLAVVRLVWTSRLTLQDGRTEVTKEPGLDVFRRQKDGSWKIVRYIAYEE
jgi:steroid delta-isomerase